MTPGQKFREWIYSTFGNPVNAGKALKISSTTFYDYFNDDTKIGPKIITKCLPYGLDLNWIYYDDTNKVKEKIIGYNTSQYDITKDNILMNLERVLNKGDQNYNAVKHTIIEISNDELFIIIFGIQTFIMDNLRMTPIKRFQKLRELFLICELPMAHFQKEIIRFMESI